MAIFSVVHHLTFSVIELKVDPDGAEPSFQLGIANKTLLLLNIVLKSVRSMINFIKGTFSVVTVYRSKILFTNNTSMFALFTFFTICFLYATPKVKINANIFALFFTVKSYRFLCYITVRKLGNEEGNGFIHFC